MRALIYGSGAVGTWVGCRLHQCGVETTFLGRGAHIAALAKHGVLLHEPAGTRRIEGLRAVGNATSLEAPDILFLGLKAQQLPPLLGELKRLTGPRTAIIAPQNGVPWWQFHGAAGPYAGRAIQSVDPGGHLLARLPGDQIYGAVINKGVMISAPGELSFHAAPNSSLVLGAAAPVGEPRVAELLEVMSGADWPGIVAPDIRAEKWNKLLLNIAINPLTALTRAYSGEAMRHAQGAALGVRLIEETLAVARAIGITLEVDPAQRIQRARDIGRFKTSMLVDAEAGRALEIDAIAGAVLELGRLTNTPTPALEAIYQTAKVLDSVLARRREEAAAKPS
ncbi:MAG TPA: 2-dehydropantoate 2-reductase [Burkholderiales bacterium]